MHLYIFIFLSLYYQTINIKQYYPKFGLGKIILCFSKSLMPINAAFILSKIK